jgi:hypothetical protein
LPLNGKRLVEDAALEPDLASDPLLRICNGDEEVEMEMEMEGIGVVSNSIGVSGGDGGGEVSGVDDEKGEFSRYIGCSGGGIGSKSYPSVLSMASCSVMT